MFAKSSKLNRPELTASGDYWEPSRQPTYFRDRKIDIQLSSAAACESTDADEPEVQHESDEPLKVRDEIG